MKETPYSQAAEAPPHPGFPGLVLYRDRGVSPLIYNIFSQKHNVKLGTLCN